MTTNPFSDNKMIESLISNAYESAQSKIQDWQNTTIKIAIAGMSGAGKSSLINAILNQKLAPVGVIETTVEPKSYPSQHGITFVDLPGCGTSQFPFESYIQKTNLASFDAIILVSSNRFYENDVQLYAQITQKLNIPCFVVRTKIDLAVNDGLEDNGLTTKQVCQMITDNIYHNLKPHRPKKVYLVSNRYRQDYDLQLLINDVCLSLEGLKRAKFRAESAAYSKEAIYGKRKVIEEIALNYAISAAFNGLNPIPALNVSIDAGILLTMSTHILRFYGLTEQQMEHFMGAKQQKVQLQALKQGITRWSAQFLATESIMQILKRLSTKLASKTIAGWIPMVGQIISAGIGYKMTISFAAELIDESEKKSLELLQTLIDS
mgnify:CR=1 FL=1|jgi:GTP-binding protein EngB required for normal cell division